MTSAPVKKVPIPPRGVDYRGKIVLAPMVRSGEMPSRLTALHYGADLVWGPETVDKSLIGTTRRVRNNIVEFTRPSVTADPNSPISVIYRLHPELEKDRLIFQLGTSNPDHAVAAARLVAPDCAGIDVNAGCPKPFSVHSGMGAALLQTPDKLVAILEALVREVQPEAQVGISVKIRLLETAEKTEVLVRRLVATGITGLTVHCRTTPMRPRERAIRGQLKMVADVCREAGVACLMNGDVETRDQAVKLMEEFGVDGAMIATAAETNMSCFRCEEEGGVLPWNDVAEKFVRIAIDVENKFGNTKFMLTRIVPGKSPKYQMLATAKSYTAVCEALSLDDMLTKAREVDDTLGLSETARAAAAVAAAQAKKERKEQAKKEKELQKQNTGKQGRKRSASPQHRAGSKQPRKDAQPAPDLAPEAVLAIPA